MLKVAIVQHAPIYLDVQASLQKLCTHIEEAAAGGAVIVAIGESWLSGYPAWLDHCPEAALWDHPPTKEVFALMYQNSICVPGPETEVLASLARQHQLTLVLGVNERVEEGPGNGSIYNSLLIIGPEGQLLNHHRKLMPTYTEKLVYALGDGRGLKSVRVNGVQIGGLICWEHWMPLARQCLHNAGEHLHVALWPTVHDIHQLASRHYAFEGRCFVLAVGQLMRVKDLPPQLRMPETLSTQPEKLLLRGGSCLIGPDGHFLLSPQWDTEAVLLAEIDPLRVLQERMTLDTSGHYQRPDLFHFELKTNG
ncbi:MAG: carbon-nitrogen hydrolase family protein [Bacteroidetes bacterium]|nr:MAG: carbon-nitrogen hydrolase family protein [Bacteroidota bacterium]